jgi:hypothetical protein
MNKAKHDKLKAACKKVLKIESIFGICVSKSLVARAVAELLEIQFSDEFYGVSNEFYGDVLEVLKEIRSEK